MTTRSFDMSRFTDALNEQIGSEFGASQQYIAIAVHYDAQTLPQLAAHFYRQAVEERNHAMMIVQYLLDADLPVAVPGVAAPVTAFDDPVAPVRIPGVTAPQTAFEDDRAPVALALEQEKTVTEQIARLVQVAREEQDFVGEQFLGWFLEEQREEVASMSSLLAVLDRAGTTSMLLVEDFLARVNVSAAAPSSAAPAAAGGAL
jgi:bacterioferritin B